MPLLRRSSVIAFVAAGMASLYACGLTIEGSAPERALADGPSSDDASPSDATRDPRGAADGTADAAVDGPPGVDAGPATSCKTLLARDPVLAGKSGIYVIEPAGRAGAPLDVYCEMTVDKGGWTMVGRSGSVSGTAPPFGWKSATGAPADETKPYSLDVDAAKLLFAEILVSDSAAGKPVATHAYKLAVPSDFLAAHGTDLIEAGTATLAGTCTPDPLTSMLHWVGATDKTDVFFFRDGNNTGQRYGLEPNRWQMAMMDCAKGADLDQKPGAIFVR